MGAPYWDTEARGAIVGLTRDSGAPEIVRAALESVVYQTRDLFEAMAADGTTPASVRVDGGMAANDWTMQFLADVLSVGVERPINTETSVLGAAYLSALGAGIYDPDDVAANWLIDKTYTPTMVDAERERLYAGWLKAVAQTRAVRLFRLSSRNSNLDHGVTLLQQTTTRLHHSTGQHDAICLLPNSRNTGRLPPATDVSGANETLPHRRRRRRPGSPGG